MIHFISLRFINVFIIDFFLVLDNFYTIYFFIFGIFQHKLLQNRMHLLRYHHLYFMKTIVIINQLIGWHLSVVNIHIPEYGTKTMIDVAACMSGEWSTQLMPNEYHR